MVVALFHDGFVCRHINKENEGVEGFAQPYDAESSYFLACIDNGRVPEGLPDMIACAHYNGSVLTEIQDYREMRNVLCPVSSAFLPTASAMPQASDDELDPNFRVWQTLLEPGKSPLPIHAQVSPLFEPPTLQSMFDHFPDVAPSELETLAMDAKRQLLQEEDVLLSSSSTESSSPREDSRGFGFFPAKSNGDEATRLEREHSRFLHTNAQRLMQAEKTPPQETEHVAGSMRYLARQLGDLTRPSDVIAVSGARELKIAEDEGRELPEPDWLDNDERRPSLPVGDSTASAVAFVTPGSEPTLHLQRIDNDGDTLQRSFFELTTDPTSLIKDYQPTAAAPHFNAFDDDGNLQLQST
ncbi:KRR1 small subunit processome component [Phytophthora cinnamomi]|uniref:KRR1 small subunit processome component n=1 Tax=Phytophthora cinnamomi TaxID=4785 RepID=UPI003559F7CF|nr:KRR1 small subunit processome component [Phytophthora cinnamomi]